MEGFYIVIAGLVLLVAWVSVFLLFRRNKQGLAPPGITCSKEELSKTLQRASEEMPSEEFLSLISRTLISHVVVKKQDWDKQRKADRQVTGEFVGVEFKDDLGTVDVTLSKEYTERLLN